jgi:hypothetical protein
MRGGPSQATIAAAGFVLALSLVATALAGSAPRRAPVHGGDTRISAAAAGAMRIEDSRGGAAILRAPALAPGAHVIGKVAISNRGEAGHLVLSRRRLAERTGAGGASLGDALELTIRNVTTGARRLVYSGPLAAMPPLRLGLLPPGAKRRYRFVASLPEPGFVDLTLMGSQARFDYRWRLEPTRP